MDYTLRLLTPINEDDGRDKYFLLNDALAKKYPKTYSKIKRSLYREDTDKVLDIIYSSILSHNNIDNFRFGRSDNRNLMQDYGKSKRNKRDKTNQFDRSVYGIETKVVYYFGFDY
ncbi:MAG: hypothetical protein H8D97_01455 [Proteobacteria bacterium]|nr:hypothetical protein [Pseudomonadota bacterium]